MVKLKVKQTVRLYVMVCLPVVSTGRVVSATPAFVVPFSPRDSARYPFLLMPLLLTTRAREGRCGKVCHHAVLASD